MSSSNLIRSSGSSTADTNDSAEFTLDLGLENKEFNKLARHLKTLSLKHKVLLTLL